MESRAYGLPGLEWARFVIVPQATKSEPANNFGPFHVKSPQVAPPKGLRPQQSSPNMRTNARENLIEEEPDQAGGR